MSRERKTAEEGRQQREEAVMRERERAGEQREAAKENDKVSAPAPLKLVHTSHPCFHKSSLPCIKSAYFAEVSLNRFLLFTT